MKLLTVDGSSIDHQVCGVAQTLHGEPVPVPQEVVILRPDGSRRTVMAHPAPVLDPTGTVCGAVNILVDVSEQKRAESALQENERQLRLIADHARAFIVHCDRQRRFKFVNRLYAERFGLTPDQVVGRTVAELVGDEAYATFRDYIDQVLAGHSLDFEVAIPYATLGTRVMHCAYTPEFGPEGEVQGFIAVLTDVTARRRIEEALREETQTADALLRVGSILAADFDLQRIVQVVTDETTQLTNAQFGAFFYNVLDPDEEAYTLYTLSGVPLEAFSQFPMPRNTAIFEPTFRGDHLVRLDDVTQDPRYGGNSPFAGMPSGHLPVRSYLAVPVVSRGGEVLGGLFFGHSQAGVFQERHERIVTSIATQAAIAIDNARLYQRTQESEARFRQFAEHITDVFWMADPRKPRMLYVSPAYERIWGRTRQSLYEHPRSILEAIHPDDRERVSHSLERQLRGETTAEEYRVVRPDNTIAWVSDRAFPIRDASGQVYRIAGVAEDITERKQLHARLEAVLSSINDHLVSYDRQWRYTFVNDRAAVVLGKTKEELLGRSIWDLFPEAVGNQYYREVHQALAEQRIIRSEHFYAQSQTWYENHIYPSLEGVTVFSADVSWRKRLEEELRLRAEQLAEADRRKDEFLATLAHELRNPLAPIRNALEVIRLAADDRHVIEQARTLMDRQVNQMVRLIDDLLDLSRITRNKVELRRERIELAAAVASAVETTRPLIDTLGHQLTVTLPPEPMFLEADLTRLAQVFSNLLTNAAKYSDRGGSISLTASCDGEGIVVRVQDRGIGIPAEMLLQIFEMFTQVDRSLERSQGGLGIGLTLVQRLVELHGGRVEARSQGIGQGSEFSVWLPRLSSAQAITPPSGASSPTAAPLQARVLVVDDNWDSAESLALLLKLRGAEVRTAHDGQEALEIAAAYQPDLIVLDIGMPRLNGYEAARQIRKHPALQHILLVAMTGWGQEEDKRRAIEAGFDLHLTKPVSPQPLEQLLQRLYRRT